MKDFPAEPTTSARGTSLLIMGVVLLVLIPVMFYGCRGEIDRWRAAVVMERYLDGQQEQSITQLQQITERLPDDFGLQATLARWLLDDERPQEALQIVDAIPQENRDRRIQGLRQDCLLASGQPKLALEAYRQANPPNATRDYEQTLQHRNSLAYLQALAATELRLASQNSNYVVNETAAGWNHLQDIQLPTHLQVYFCAAMLYREQARRIEEESGAGAADKFRAAALARLDPAITELQDDRDIIQRLDPQAITDALRSLLGMEVEDDDEKLFLIARRKDENAHSMAAFLTLRALIYQDLGQRERSFADRRAVIELGYDPEMVADKFPDLQLCAFQLIRMAPFMDTRGCVRFQMNRLESSLMDLNAAVASQRAIVEVPFAAPRTRFEASLDPRQQYEFFVRAPQRSLAVLLFHRSWVLRALDDDTGAQADVAEIRELGFKPGNFLF